MATPGVPAGFGAKPVRRGLPPGVVPVLWEIRKGSPMRIAPHAEIRADRAGKPDAALPVAGVLP